MQASRSFQPTSLLGVSTSLPRLLGSLALSDHTTLAVGTGHSPSDINSAMFDVVIVGAGPAGLNAALILGRCQRKVLLCDTGKPRNAASWHLNGFLSRDGIDPSELRRIGREQLKPYDTVTANDIEVIDAVREDNHFTIWLADGSRVQSRKLLLTTGLVDKLPDIEGFQEF